MTDAIRGKLGSRVDRANLNSQYVRVFTFRYKSLSNVVAGYMVAPKCPGEEGVLPVILYNRGGTGDFGLVKQGMLFTEISELARWGYVVIGSQYSGNSLSEGHDEHGGADLQGILDLYPLVERLTCVDANRIGMFGVSRGGMMTYLCMAQVSWVKAAVTLAGAANLVRGEKLRPEMTRIFTDSFGGSQTELRRRSAVYWPKRIAGVPLLLLHGSRDPRVSVQDSLDLTGKLCTLGGATRLVIFEGGDHLISQHRAEWLEQTRAWFDKFLRVPPLLERQGQVADQRR